MIQEINLKNKINQAIKNGWKFLEENQNKSGQFLGYSLLKNTKLHLSLNQISNTPFTTALILNFIKPLQNFPEIRKANFDKITKLGASYLISEKIIPKGKSQYKDYYLWSYWSKSDPRHNSLPPDLDDTALCLASIKQYRPKKISPHSLTYLINLLIFAERKTGGPYNTWLIDYKNDQRWNDCDPVVNANIAYLLSLLEIKLPNINKYFEKLIFEKKIISKYYREPIVVLYFIARSYSGDKQNIFISKILEHRLPNKTWGSTLLTALGVSALIYLGENSQKYTDQIEYILSEQEYDSSENNFGQNSFWLEEALYYEYRNKNGEYFHGSKTLSTSICLETLCLFYNANFSSKIKNLRENGGVSIKKDSRKKFDFGENDNENKKEYNEEFFYISQKFVFLAKSVSEEFEEQARIWLEKICRSKWLCEFIFLTAKNKKRSVGQKESGEVLKLNQEEEISLACLFGVVGYSIFDEILDGESSLSLLAFANFCLRKMNYFYEKIFSKELLSLVQEILDQTDKAYFDEQKFQVKNMGQNLIISDLLISKISEIDKIPLEDKSLGLVIPALYLFGETNEEKIALINLYKNFLGAKQMSDDAEDILTDLEHGHITRTNAQIINSLFQKGFKTINIKKNKREILKIFWLEVYPKIQKKILEKLKLSEKIINDKALKVDATNKQFFLDQINSLRDSVSKTNQERQKIKLFIKVYEKHS